MANLLGGGGMRFFVCERASECYTGCDSLSLPDALRMCVCVGLPPLDRVSLMTQSPAFSAQNSVSSAFTKERAIRSKPPGPTQRLQCSTPPDNASIFKCFIYTHPFSYLRTLILCQRGFFIAKKNSMARFVEVLKKQENLQKFIKLAKLVSKTS